MTKLNYILSNQGKFHHFEVAKILYKRKKNKKIICGYPWFKLKHESIPKKLVASLGFLRILREPIHRSPYFKKLDNFLNILNAKNIDRVTCNYIDHIDDADVLLALSGSGLNSGKKIKKNNKIYVCERSSAHIVSQNNILSEEYKKYTNKNFKINSWFIERELEEYENADIILTPSTFVKNTFGKSLSNKTKVLEFGADINNFFVIDDESKSQNFFDILFIGQISLQKGLHYLIEAFNAFNHPNKRLHIVGSNTVDYDFFHKKLNNENIVVYGHVPHTKLNRLINKCHLIVLPSIQDGFGLVISQAAAAGCPAIVSENAGSADFVKKNNCGFVVPYKNAEAITDKLQLLADDKSLLKKLSFNAINSTKNYTWSDYVTKLDNIILEFKKNKI